MGDVHKPFRPSQPQSPRDTVLPSLPGVLTLSEPSRHRPPNHGKWALGLEQGSGIPISPFVTWFLWRSQHNWACSCLRSSRSTMHPLSPFPPPMSLPTPSLLRPWVTSLNKLSAPKSLSQTLCYGKFKLWQLVQVVAVEIQPSGWDSGTGHSLVRWSKRSLVISAVVIAAGMV